MQARPVFPLNNRPFSADGSHGIEYPDPDAGANQGKGSASGLLIGNKGILSCHHTD